MRELAWKDFAGAEGSDLVFETPAGPVALTLVTAAELPASGRAAGSFRLEFRGPFEPILPQAIYRLHLGEESAEMFIVPVGREPKGTLFLLRRHR